MAITVRDIAKESGVSPGTVSRVLNNRANVKEDTRKKILNVINKLQYNPLDNMPLAKRVQPTTIGLCIPYPDTISPYYSRAIHSAMRNTNQNNYSCSLFSEFDFNNHSNNGEQGGVNKILSCDGLILFSIVREYGQYLKVLSQQAKPVVLVKRKSPFPDVPVIYDDDYAGSMLAMDHLHSLGHRNIGYIGVNGNENFKDRPGIKEYSSKRMGAYDDFRKAHGLEFSSYLFYLGAKPRGPDDFKQGLAEIMERPENPTAFFCAGDFYAIETIKNLRQAGIRVPEDIAIVGYNNDYTAQIHSPGITTVNIPVEEMMDQAYKMIFKMIKGEALEVSEIKMNNKLIVRESCGASLKK